MPTYEFIIGLERDEHHAGCDALTGLVGEGDAVANDGDPRWQAIAKVGEAETVQTANGRCKGEVSR